MIEMRRLLKGLEPAWQAPPAYFLSASRMPGGAHVGLLAGRPGALPYLAIQPIAANRGVMTNKGLYPVVEFEVGIVHTDGDLAAELEDELRGITEKAEVGLASGWRLVEIKHQSSRDQQEEGFWIVWGTYRARLSRNRTDR